VAARRIYQTIALSSLLAIWCAAIEMGVRHVAPVSWIVDAIGPAAGGFVTWIVATLVWALAMLPIRPMARFATLAETMEKEGIHSAADFGRRVGERRMAMRSMAAGTPEERRRYHLLMAGGGAIVALVSGLVSIGNFLVAPDTFLLAPPVLAAVSAALVPYHLARAALAR
jgi:hypothetical protein